MPEQKKFLDKAGLQKVFQLIKNYVDTASSGTATIINDIAGYFTNGVLQVSHGGTGVTNLSSFVRTTGNQTISGTKTFNSTISGNINGNAATATKLGSSTIGGTYKPIYLLSGEPKRVGYNASGFEGNKGSDTKPIYLSSDGLTESNANVGSDERIMYITSGTLTAGKRIETRENLPTNLSNYNVGDVVIVYSNS